MKEGEQVAKFRRGSIVGLAVVAADRKRQKSKWEAMMALLLFLMRVRREEDENRKEEEQWTREEQEANREQQE